MGPIETLPSNIELLGAQSLEEHRLWFTSQLSHLSGSTLRASQVSFLNSSLFFFKIRILALVLYRFVMVK